MTTDAPVLTIEADRAVRIVTLNRPDELNAISHDLHQAIAGVWQALREDRAARAVVLTGAGRAFSSGGDVPGFLQAVEDEEYRQSSFEFAARLVRDMLAFPLPVVAAVNGPAVGLGASLAVMADIVYMSEKAFLADPHVAVGLVAADGGVVTWPSMMSILRAKEYIFTGDRIPAHEAVQLGLANRVFAPEELLPAALAFAHRLADLPAQPLQGTKRALNLHLIAAAERVLPYALAAEELSFGQPEVAQIAADFAARSNGHGREPAPRSPAEDDVSDQQEI
jgi:enoyl-CoA hydratase/carnithine racemase